MSQTHTNSRILTPIALVRLALGWGAVVVLTWSGPLLEPLSLLLLWELVGRDAPVVVERPPPLDCEMLAERVGCVRISEDSSVSTWGVKVRLGWPSNVVRAS